MKDEEMVVMNIRVPRKLLMELDRIAEFEKIDRSSLVRRILDEGVKRSKLNMALLRYLSGEVSIGKAAEIAGVSLWEFIDYMRERGVSSNVTAVELLYIIEQILEGKPEIREKLREKLREVLK